MESTGSDTFIHAEISGQKIVILTHQRLDSNPGDQIRLSVQKEKMLLFDSSSGKRIRE